MQRLGATRSAQQRIDRQGRLAPAVDLCVDRHARLCDNSNVACDFLLRVRCGFPVASVISIAESSGTREPLGMARLRHFRVRSRLAIVYGLSPRTAGVALAHARHLWIRPHVVLCLGCGWGAPPSGRSGWRMNSVTANSGCSGRGMPALFPYRTPLGPRR